MMAALRITLYIILNMEKSLSGTVCSYKMEWCGGGGGVTQKFFFWMVVRGRGERGQSTAKCNKETNKQKTTFH